MKGWISLHRKILENPIWTSEPFTRGQAWVDLLLLANHETNYFYVRGVKVVVERGQVGWSEPKLAGRWKWSRTKVRKFLKDIEKEQQIILHKNNVTQVITIVNYEEYQAKEQQVRQQKDSRKTAEEQQKDVNNNDNNDNKNNNILSQVDKSTLDTPLSGYFDIAISFWNLFRNNLVDLKISTDEIDKAKFDKWVTPIRLLIENDKKTIDEIREVYIFLQNDEFWSEQIRSTAKLRKKDKNGEKYFDKLLFQSRNHAKNRKTGKSGNPGTETAKTVESILAEIEATQR